MRHLADDRFESLSAGSTPAGFIHPLAIQAMKHLNITLENQRSKSWDEFSDTPLDVVITLCDQAAGETCPIWKESPIVAHWSLPDPSFHSASEEDRVEFAVRIATRLIHKIRALIELDYSMDSEHLQQRISFLGEI